MGAGAAKPAVRSDPVSVGTVALLAAALTVVYAKNDPSTPFTEVGQSARTGDGRITRERSRSPVYVHHACGTGAGAGTEPALSQAVGTFPGMSYGLMAYSVDLDLLSRTAPASYRSQCELHGSFLPNGPFYPVKYWWLADVDEVLADLGVDEVRVESLGMGAESGEEWSGRAVRRAAEQARAVPRAQVQALEDRYMREAVQTVLEWIRTAAEQGHGIVGFYH